jgi:hypothetical protein
VKNSISDLISCSLLSKGCLGEVKRPKRDADLSRLIPRPRKLGSVHPLPPIRLYGVMLN